MSEGIGLTKRKQSLHEMPTFKICNSRNDVEFVNMEFRPHPNFLPRQSHYQSYAEFPPTPRRIRENGRYLAIHIVYTPPARPITQKVFQPVLHTRLE